MVRRSLNEYVEPVEKIMVSNGKVIGVKSWNNSSCMIDNLTQMEWNTVTKKLHCYFGKIRTAARIYDNFTSMSVT
jgi:hypothetical protein